MNNIKRLLKEKFNIEADSNKIKIVATIQNKTNRIFIKYKKKHFVYAICDGCKLSLLKQTKPSQFIKIINRKTIYCCRECMHIVIETSNCLRCNEKIEITPVTKDYICKKPLKCRRYAVKEGILVTPSGIEINCSYCNKTFFITQYLYDKQEYHSCSRECGSIIHKQIMSEIWANRTNEEKQKIFNEMGRTYSKKHGVSHPMHNPDVLERVLEKTTHGKHGKFLSKKNNKELNYASSFEKQAFSILEHDNTILSFDRGPTIEYTFENKNKIYHSDIYATYSDNTSKIIEVKSKGTFFDKFNKNIAKFKAANIYATKNNDIFEIWMESNLTKKLLCELIKKYNYEIPMLPEIMFIL